jgi:hypothetical protein
VYHHRRGPKRNGSGVVTGKSQGYCVMVAGFQSGIVPIPDGVDEQQHGEGEILPATEAEPDQDKEEKSLYGSYGGHQFQS